MGQGQSILKIVRSNSPWAKQGKSNIAALTQVTSKGARLYGTAYGSADVAGSTGWTGDVSLDLNPIALQKNPLLQESPTSTGTQRWT